MKKKLYRNTKDEKIAGVCSGIAEYFGIDPTIVRVIWACAILCAGSGLLLYIICAFVMPEKPAEIDQDYPIVD